MDNTISLGIGCGLGAAFFQSLSYVCIRRFNKRHDDNIVALLAISHIIMGIISIPMAAILWPNSMPAAGVYLPALLGVAGFYLCGQFFLSVAIVHSEPSRVSPLLGLKVFIVTLISAIFLGLRFGPGQWLAVILTTAAVLMLSYSGKRIQGRFILLGLAACVSYCLSDLLVKVLVDHFEFMGILRGAMMATALSYILCGVVGVAVVMIYPRHSTRDTWLYALPFAASWFIAMIFLFSCFGLIGVVFGSILQSARGILSIVLGFVIAHLGFEALEPKPTKRIVVLRIIAAVLMTAAVVLFLK
ncbi:MAG: EamA family transporter [Planctomycetota bacterium]|jgi:drug/metabolite transporter (DMT)-like permease